MALRAPEPRMGAEVVKARHAEVVPSFCVRWLRRPLVSRIGDIASHELIRWERPGDLTVSMRDNLRMQVIKRLRLKAEEVWGEPVNVYLEENWGDRLLPSERNLIENLLHTCAVPFHALALKQVKESVKQPLDRVLSILARIESTYWVPPALSTAEQYVLRDRHEKVEIQLDADERALANIALELPWVADVTATDLRFEFKGSGLASDWIREQLALPLASSRLPALVERLIGADKLTAAEEAREIATAASLQCQTKQPSQSFQRWASMLMARHISATGPGLTLQEVGVAFSVTRERIRQVCEAMETVILERRSVAPALSRVLRIAARIVPCSVEEANDQLARYIGTGAGIEALVPWAKTLGQTEEVVRCEQGRVRLRGQLMEVKMVVLAGASQWTTYALRHASRDCSVMGCTNVMRVAGQLSLTEGLAPGQEPLKAALSAAQGFRWLDDDSGWFTLGDSTASAAATRVRKIVAVAHMAVGADQIAAAFASDDQWLYREESRAFATPPPHVLRELFLGWDFLKVVQKGRFEARSKVDLGSVLSPSEFQAVKVIEEHEGAACHFELKAGIMGTLGLTDIAVASMLGRSPIIVKFEHGIYTLRGRRVGDAAVDDARVRMRTRIQGQSANRPRLGPNEFRICGFQ